MRMTILLAAALAAGRAGAETGAASVKATAEGSGISGTVQFADTKDGLKVAVVLTGLPPGTHGFHIHEFGSCADAGKAAGAHYNPKGAPHGSAVHHGIKKPRRDLGNVIAGADGKATSGRGQKLSLASGKPPWAGVRSSFMKSRRLRPAGGKRRRPHRLRDDRWPRRRHEPDLTSSGRCVNFSPLKYSRIEQSPAAPAPAAKPTAKPAAAMNRADFLLAGWGLLAGFIGAFSAASARFFFPNVIYEPSQKFNAGPALSFDIGVSTKWLSEQRVWIIRTEKGFYALWARCTHLGCTPNWFSDQNRSKCPCHGSNFTQGGDVIAGPAPQPLLRAKIELAKTGDLIVDKAFLQNKPGTRDQNPFFVEYTA